MPAIQSFKDLIAWQRGHQLCLVVYKATKIFPPDELFALTSQMRRAAVSVTSNIAEGFCRQSQKEKVQFYFVSLGSVAELESQLAIAFDLGYIAKEENKKIATLLVESGKLINGLIRSLRQ